MSVHGIAILEEREVSLPVVLVVVDGNTNEILDVRVEQPQFVTAMLALRGRKNGKTKGKEVEG